MPVSLLIASARIALAGWLAEMVREDLKAAQPGERVKKHGYAACDYHA